MYQLVCRSAIIGGQWNSKECIQGSYQNTVDSPLLTKTLFSVYRRYQNVLLCNLASTSPSYRELITDPPDSFALLPPPPTISQSQILEKAFDLNFEYQNIVSGVKKQVAYFSLVFFATILYKGYRKR